MRKCDCRIGVLEGADGVVARPSDRGGNFGNKKRGHNYRVASFLNGSKDLKALGMASFVRIERIHEHTRVDCVSDIS
jgi:hypothetical protein